MKKILDVPLIDQQHKTDCGVACIAMVMAYDGTPYNQQEITAHFKADQPECTGLYVPELGLPLLEQHYQVTLKTMNPFLLNVNHIDASQQELRDHMAWLKADRYADQPSRLEGVEKFRLFMEAGGIVAPGIPTENDIRHEIDNDRPVMASVTNGFMGLAKILRVGYNSHFVVVKGYDDDGFYVNDPSPRYNQGASMYYTNTQMMYAIYACASGDIDNGSIMKTVPKPV